MRFNIVKYICILIFISILVLFTIGYTSQPILNLTATASINLQSIPTDPKITINTPSLPNNGNYKFSVYLNKIVNNTDNSTINYNNINSTLDIVSKFMNYIFIGISVCIGIVILLSFIGLKIISYIPLLIALITMIIICIIIFVIYSTGFLSSILNQYISSQSQHITLSNTKIIYDTGGIFITLSTGLLLVNYFLYMMLG